MEKLRVLIADDDPLFRDGMRDLLATQQDIEVTGEATTSRRRGTTSSWTASRVVPRTSPGELEPDVVLMDIKMLGLGGIEATAAS